MKLICDSVHGRKELTPAQAVAYVVDCAPDYHDGAVERATRSLEKLTELVGALYAAVPPEKAVELLNANHFEKFTLENE